MPPKPRWMAYRSAKWFQCAMEDARDEVGKVCGFCRMAGFDGEINWESDSNSCARCAFGDDEGNMGCISESVDVTVASVWGEFA